MFEIKIKDDTNTKESKMKKYLLTLITTLLLTSVLYASENMFIYAGTLHTTSTNTVSKPSLSSKNISIRNTNINQIGLGIHFSDYYTSTLNYSTGVNDNGTRHTNLTASINYIFLIFQGFVAHIGTSANYLSATYDFDTGSSIATSIESTGDIGFQYYMTNRVILMIDYKSKLFSITTPATGTLSGSEAEATLATDSSWSASLGFTF